MKGPFKKQKITQFKLVNGQNLIEINDAPALEIMRKAYDSCRVQKKPKSKVVRSNGETKIFYIKP